MKNKYEEYMQKCLDLALLADGKTSPNPMVGCIILNKEGQIISTGYHHKCGEAHAERDALLKLKDNEAEGGTIIVSLEPCSHYGKTPPCADLIIEKKLKTLVYGMKDVNPIVAGNGLKKCKDAGIEIIGPILEENAKEINEVFIKNMKEKATFVAIKSASTIDGKIATSNGSSKWITSEKAREEVQKIRNRYDAILTTSSTIIADNPSMTCRLDNGKKLTKIILDRTLKTDFNSKVYKTEGESIYVAIDKEIPVEKLNNIPQHINIIKVSVKNNKIDLKELFEKLFELKITSVLVEAGGTLNGDIIAQGLADKIYQFIAPKILGDKSAINNYEGCSKNSIDEAKIFEIKDVKMFSPDVLLTLKKKS